MGNGRGKKRFVTNERGLRRVGGARKGEYDRAIAIAGMGLAISGSVLD